MSDREDPFPILGFDHLELYVGNAAQAVHFYRSLGFSPVAFRGLPTGSRDAVSWCLRQGEVTFVLTGALGPESPIADHVRLHGDGVHDVAFTVADAQEAYAAALERGARGVAEPEVLEDEHGKVVRASIAAYGETIHSFVSRHDYSGPFLPGFRALPAGRETALAIRRIDHVVGNVELGRMDEWVSFYERVMGFAEMRHFSDREISTEYSALMSKVLWDGVGTVKLPINEPATGRHRSQIEEYLMYYRSPGVQHVALLTDDIVATVGAMQAEGIRFLRVPDTYYEEVVHRVPEVAGDIEALRSNGILVDRDDDGHLLQIFTEPLQDRPTFFLELIERHGSKGFAAGNFKALFESIEREQAMRGNL
ncbi:MAG TPA: 4-hydroxyphenylpyruvate dioxygenase [Actinomycetota bacterium]|nr:4-hydroxyphenylpyruvate dioxygenase [Actinomycetota bacterium]